MTSCSDTLIPERGRKRLRHLLYYLQSHAFRYLNPREGTETGYSIIKVRSRPEFRYLNPREGTETRGYFLLFADILSSDTLIPERGRKQLPQSETMKPLSSFRYLNPREGTETLSPFRLVVITSRSDTLLPERGRKPGDVLLMAFKYLVQIPYSPRGDGNFLSVLRLWFF